jgi:hypothetical protein
MRLADRIVQLGAPMDRIYKVNYPRLSWYVHSGVTGIVNLKSETFVHLCANAFSLVAGVRPPETTGSRRWPPGERSRLSLGQCLISETFHRRWFGERRIVRRPRKKQIPHPVQKANGVRNDTLSRFSAGYESVPTRKSALGKEDVFSPTQRAPAAIVIRPRKRKPE